MQQQGLTASPCPHAINREDIKELAFLGIGEARQGVPAPFHPLLSG